MVENVQDLQRGLSWKEGLYIATGVPVLVLPSIGFFGTTVWAFSIIIWILSVCQGFFQCTAYAELATLYKDKPGLAGFVFESYKKRSRLIPAFASWGYWFAWNPVLAINALLLGDFLNKIAFPNVSSLTLSLIFGTLMLIVLLIINYYGAMAGAWTQLALAILSLLPLVGLSILPFILGKINYSYYSTQFLPPDWNWASWQSWFVIIGLMALAQWSACAWETAAVYASEYRDPHKDTPKALFSAGGLCLITFPLAQAACIGVLGVDGLANNPVSPFVDVAKIVLGPVGSVIAVVMLIASLFLVANTALMGSSRALYTMAKDGQIPAFFGRLNKHGTPFLSAFLIVLLNIVLMFMKTPILVLSASALGYIFINGLTLFGFILSRIDDRDAPRAFKAPSWWVVVALFFGLLNIPLYIIGNAWSVGTGPTILGTIVLLTIIPLYYFTQSFNKKQAGTKSLEI